MTTPTAGPEAHMVSIYALKAKSIIMVTFFLMNNQDFSTKNTQTYWELPVDQQGFGLNNLDIVHFQWASGPGGQREKS